MTVDPNILKEARFQPPQGWFEQIHPVASDRFLRYGRLIPQKMRVKKTLVIVPGNQESLEKYFEFIHDLHCHDHGIQIFIYDPFGQGESGRDLDDHKKMHSVGFERDIADLNHFVEHVVLPHHESVNPLIMMGHSKGGHFLMRYLTYTDHRVDRAIFVAPMLGIHTGMIPSFVTRFITHILYHCGWGMNYVPGAALWREDQHVAAMQKRLSHDQKRNQIRHLWALKRPQQQMSAVTIGWLYHALQSVDYLSKKTVLQKMTVPSLMITAMGDTVVSIPAQNRAVQILPNCQQVKIPHARHDIWMEHDQYRAPFIKAVKDFIFANE